MILSITGINERIFYKMSYCWLGPGLLDCRNSVWWNLSCLFTLQPTSVPHRLYLTVLCFFMLPFHFAANQCSSQTVADGTLFFMLPFHFAANQCSLQTVADGTLFFMLPFHFAANQCSLQTVADGTLFFMLPFHFAANQCSSQTVADGTLFFMLPFHFAANQCSSQTVSDGTLAHLGPVVSGSTPTLTCKTGFIPLLTVPVTCGANGGWGTTPACQCTYITEQFVVDLFVCFLFYF